MSRPFPTLLLGVICVSIVCIFLLPGTSWGFVLKSIFGLWILVLLKVAARKMILPGTLLSALFFTAGWYVAPSLWMNLFFLLTLGSLFVTYRTVESHFGGFRDIKRG